MLRQKFSQLSSGRSMMLRRKWGFICSCLGILSAIFLVTKSMKAPPEAPPLIEPAHKPFPDVVAAAGIIEPLREHVCVGSHESGIVQEVYVKVGDRVHPGDPLFKLDSSHLEAELNIDQAKEEVALAEYHKIHDLATRLRSIQDPRAISQEEVYLRGNEEKQALAKLHHMQMEKEKTVSLLDRLLIKSPMEGVVLQKNIHVGEYLIAHNTDTPPLILGDVSLLQVRADVDEQNARHIVPGAQAIACPKNQPDIQIPLTFAHVEPYVVPKKSLTGSSKEKIDTRVLQVVYTFEPPKEFSLYIGQQVDVFIEKTP